MYLLLFLVYFIFSLVIAIQLHETGHFLFGKISGYSLIRFKIGPLCWKYENGRYLFEWEKSKGFLGLCMMMPPEHDISENRHLLYYSGGILMNLLTGSISVGLALLFPSWPPALLLFLWEFGGLSILLGSINLIPRFSMNNPTDGKIISSILKKDDLAKDMTYINNTLQQLATGIRPKDIPWLNKPLSMDKASQELFIYKLIYHLYNAIDRQDTGKIRDCTELIEKCADKIPSAIECPVKFELCGAYCILEETEKIRRHYRYLSKEKLEKEKDMSAYRIKAYIAYYLQADRQQAFSYCRKALSVADTFPVKGQMFMEKELVERLMAKIEEDEK